MQLYVICYDISEDDIRTRVAAYLQAEGAVRCNKSVFEASLSAKDKAKILRQLEQWIDKRTDSVLCYRICTKCYQYSQKLPEDDATDASRIWVV
jgi:CRISPR-associated endonuclease Cas2